MIESLQSFQNVFKIPELKKRILWSAGVLIADQFKKTGNWPLGSAMAFILLAVFLFAYFLVLQGFKLLRWTPRSRWH